MEISSVSSEHNSMITDASSSHRETRSAVQQKSNLPAIVEVSSVFTSQQRKELYNTFTREMKPG